MTSDVQTYLLYQMHILLHYRDPLGMYATEIRHCKYLLISR